MVIFDADGCPVDSVQCTATSIEELAEKIRTRQGDAEQLVATLWALKTRIEELHTEIEAVHALVCGVSRAFLQGLGLLEYVYVRLRQFLLTLGVS